MYPVKDLPKNSDNLFPSGDKSGGDHTGAILVLVAMGALFLFGAIILSRGDSDGDQPGGSVLTAIPTSRRSPTARAADCATGTAYIVGEQGNIRACASLDCDVVAVLQVGARVAVYSSDGDWCRVMISGGKSGYVYVASLGRTQPATLQATMISTEQPQPIATNQPTRTKQPTATRRPAATQRPAALQCGTCSQMSSCSQAYQCLRAGHSSLDRDGDGVPCESICPGG